MAFLSPLEKSFKNVLPWVAERYGGAAAEGLTETDSAVPTEAVRGIVSSTNPGHENCVLHKLVTLPAAPKQQCAARGRSDA